MKRRPATNRKAVYPCPLGAVEVDARAEKWKPLPSMKSPVGRTRKGQARRNACLRAGAGGSNCCRILCKVEWHTRHTHAADDTPVSIEPKSTWIHRG